MNITEISNRRVKLCYNSITVKDTNGKTCGIVKNICSFRNLPSRYKMNLWGTVRKSGIANDLTDNIIFDGNKLYYLHNLRPIETYQKIFSEGDNADFQSEKQYNGLLLSAAESAQKCGMTVLPCYVM